jgi:drug/metabolite transporter (DMT)-like permease
MFWIILGLSSHFFWGLANVGDKYIVGNKIKNPYVFLIWLNMIGILSVVIIPFIDFQWYLKGNQFAQLFGASALYFFGGFPYIKAVQIEEITRVNIWWGFIPIFSLLFGWLLFGETLSANQMIAFIILVSAAFVGSIHIRKKSFSISRAMWLMIVATASLALYAVLVHELMKTMNFGSVFVWYHIIAFVFASFMMLFPNIRKESKEIFAEMNSTTASVVFGVSLLDHVGIFFSQWAMSLASAALVFSLEGSQAIFVFVITLIVAKFNKKLLGEEFDRANVVLKVVAMVLMVVGVLVLSFG